MSPKADVGKFPVLSFQELKVGGLSQTFFILNNLAKYEILQNYTPSKSLPKIGDNIFTDYVDKTKGISEE